MSGKLHKQPFVFTSKFVARKPFTFDGKEYLPGDDFNAEKVGCEARKLRNMYEAGLIRNKVEDEVPAAKTKTVKEDKKIVESDEDEDNEVETDEADKKRQQRAARRAAKKLEDSLVTKKKKRKG